MISDLFWAFQPKRVIVPSLPLRLTRPLMPRLLLVVEFELRLFRMVVVRDLLHQPGAEDRRGNPERRCCCCGSELSKSSCLMLQPASLTVPGDHEQRVHAAVATAIPVELEARFADGAVRRDERRDVVARESQVSRDPEQRVRRRAGATDSRLHVAARASHEVEARADAIGDVLFFREVLQPNVEHFPLIRGQTRGEVRRRQPVHPGRQDPSLGTAPGSTPRRRRTSRRAPRGPLSTWLGSWPTPTFWPQWSASRRRGGPYPGK